MPLKGHQVRILDLLIEQELLLAKMYKMFATKFPAAQIFWNEISGEEVEHAAWLDHLRESAMKGNVIFDEGKTRTYTVTVFIEYVKKTFSEFEKEAIPMERALVRALDIENSLIEKNVFSSFRGDSVEIRNVMDKLRDATKEHRERMKQYSSGSLSRD